MGFLKMSRIHFITIGFVEFHKGQDLLIQAIRALDEAVLAECSFTIVGNKSSLFAQDLERQINDVLGVEMIGLVDRDEIHRLLSRADVLICPSREDSMPTVCAEAMMHKVPCLVSDAIGTASYIKDGYDGMIFESENVNALRDKIIWCIENTLEVRKMGERSFEIYKQFFSTEAFEANLLKYVEEML